MAVEREHRTLTTATPVHWRKRESRSGGDAVGGAGSLRGGVCEEEYVRTEDDGQIVVVPGGIELRDVGDVEAAMFQAAGLRQDFEPVQHRIDVPVRLIERGIGRTACTVALAHGRTGRDAGTDGDATERGETPWRARDVDLPDGLPEADADAHLAKGGGPQEQTGVPTFSMSSWPICRIVVLPMLMGKMHDQQMSVIGFMNLPVQVTLEAARAGWHAQSTTINKASSLKSDFIDS